MPTFRDEKYEEAKILYTSTTTAIGRYQLQPLIYKDAGDLVGFLLFPSDLSLSTLDLGIQSFALHPAPSYTFSIDLYIPSRIADLTQSTMDRASGVSVPVSDLGKKEMESITQQTSITAGQHVPMVRCPRACISTQPVISLPYPYV